MLGWLGWLRSLPGTQNIAGGRARPKRVASTLVFFLGVWPCLAHGSAEPGDPKRGEAVFRLAGGCSCHTDLARGGAPMAGGRPMATPFGTLYSTNITPDPETGIGGWSADDFTRAMTEGISPSGENYFPAFPYTSFAKMAPRDLADLRAYLGTLPPVRQANKPHELPAPFGWRFALHGWKWIFFRPGPWRNDPSQSAKWNRGAYIAEALSHCSECHTPRNFLGGLKTSLYWAGSQAGPEGQAAPNITADPVEGLGEWTHTELKDFFATGMKKNGDFTEKLMGEVIEHGYQYASPADLEALAIYVKSVPARQP